VDGGTWGELVPQGRDVLVQEDSTPDAATAAPPRSRLRRDSGPVVEGESGSFMVITGSDRREREMTDLAVRA
jgi:hypothetical protein